MGLLRVRTIGRQIAIKQGGAGERLVVFEFHGMTVRIRGEDQEAEDQGGQGRHESRGELDHIRRVLAQMMLRQPGAKCHAQQRAGKQASQGDDSDQ